MSAVVVGASGTIGRACVDQFNSRGYRVIALDMSPPDIPGVTGDAIDVTDREAVFGIIERIDTDDPITALVYAAGVNATGEVDKIQWDDYDRLMAVNLQGAFHVGAAWQCRCRAVARTAASVFLSSTAGLVGEAGGSIYVATKFGLRGFVESFAAELAPLGARANTVCPGNVDSVMLTRLATQFAQRQSTTTEAVLDQLAASSAFNRLITPSEVANTCAWLCSEEAGGISGQTIVVDGPPT